MTLPSSVTETPETDSDRVSGQVTDAQIDAIYRGLVEAGVSLSFPSTVSPASAMRAALRRSTETDKAVPAPATGGEDDEMYEIGKRDGYEEAVQDIDLLTGGDGEYRVSVFLEGGVDDDRHCPDPAAMKARIAERFAALRRSTETDKPGVREAALEEAAKVAASFGDPVCNPFTFTRHAHAQEVATAIRALSASPAREEQAVDVEADRRERASKVEPDKHGHRTRFSDSSYFDEVCIMCGATDGFGDKRLDQPCPSPLHHGRRDQ